MCVCCVSRHTHKKVRRRHGHNRWFCDFSVATPPPTTTPTITPPTPTTITPPTPTTTPTTTPTPNSTPFLPRSAKYSAPCHRKKCYGLKQGLCRVWDASFALDWGDCWCNHSTHLHEMSHVVPSEGSNTHPSPTAESSFSFQRGVASLCQPINYELLSLPFSQVAPVRARAPSAHAQ